ncbi:MAG: protein BatD, partial [Gammaproteobacteria bacterium]|nr:protein BatD [Gammaproteobacteria bacterium]
AAGALLEWGKARWPDAPPMSLRALADRAADAQRPALEALEQALYGAGSGESAWRGDVLWQAVEHGLGPDPGRDRADRARADDLAPLYPYRT